MSLRFSTYLNSESAQMNRLRPLVALPVMAVCFAGCGRSFQPAPDSTAGRATEIRPDANPSRIADNRESNQSRTNVLAAAPQSNSGMQNASQREKTDGENRNAKSTSTPRGQANKAIPDDDTTHIAIGVIETPIGTATSAHFSNSFDIYLYDAGSQSKGMKTREYFLVVTFESKEKEFGPWIAEDYSVIDAQGTSSKASLIDVGGQGYYCSVNGLAPATSIEKLTRTSGDKSVCHLQFSNILDTEIGDLTLRYKNQSLKLKRKPSRR